MNRDERLLLFAVGAASPLETLVTRVHLACSPLAKARYRRFVAVSEMFQVTLADPDDRIEIEIKRPRGTGRQRLASYWLLSLLGIVLFIEWRSFTIPVIIESLKSLAHRCGIQ